MASGKSKKYKTSYSDDMQKQFPFVRKCSSNVARYQHKFHCTICNDNFSLAAGGSNDIIRHTTRSTMHKEKAASLKSKFHPEIIISLFQN